MSITKPILRLNDDELSAVMNAARPLPLYKRASKLRKPGESLGQAYVRLFTGVRAEDPIGQRILHKLNSFAGLTRPQQQQFGQGAREVLMPSAAARLSVSRFLG